MSFPQVYKMAKYKKMSLLELGTFSYKFIYVSIFIHHYQYFVLYQHSSLKWVEEACYRQLLKAQPSLLFLLSTQ